MIGGISEETPVAVIGSGPVGLAAAMHLLQRGLPVRIYERGERVAQHVRDWGHVSLFSPWRYNIDPAASAMLEATGWFIPDLDHLPTGHELCDAYLEPIAGIPVVSRSLHLGTEVLCIVRDQASSGAVEPPFRLLVLERGGKERMDRVGAVIDCSGVGPRPLGGHGCPAIGENEHGTAIEYGCPDVLGTARERYIGKSIAVIGAGASAATSLLALSKLHSGDEDAKLYWVLRRPLLRADFGSGGLDDLPDRARLGAELEKLYRSGALIMVDNFFTEMIELRGDRIAIHGSTPRGPRVLSKIDRVIGATGQRPNSDITEGLRIALHPVLKCHPAIGDIIDPAVHACGTVEPHGYNQLRFADEPSFFMAGAKAYGTASSFLMAIGYEQVRSIAAGLSGDWLQATKMALSLPRTGVCTVNTPGCCIGKSERIDTGAVQAAGVSQSCCGPANAPPGSLAEETAAASDVDCCRPARIRPVPKAPTLRGADQHSDEIQLVERLLDLPPATTRTNSKEIGCCR